MSNHQSQPGRPSPVTPLLATLWGVGSGLAVLLLAYTLGDSGTPAPAAVAALLAAYTLMLAANTALMAWLSSRLPADARRRAPPPTSGPQAAALLAGNTVFLLILAITAGLDLTHSLLLLAPGTALYAANVAVFRWLLSPAQRTPQEPAE